MTNKNDFTIEAVRNINMVLGEAINRNCDLQASMKLIINVLVRNVDDADKLDKFIVDMANEFNTKMLTIIPAASDLIN